jgi:C4-dicarboxylate-specific signal transduction histidine kinase
MLEIYRHNHKEKKRDNRARQDGEVVVTVADDGSGIPSDDLPHIFEPFYTTKGPHGMALGLWVAPVKREISGKAGLYLEKEYGISLRNFSSR